MYSVHIAQLTLSVLTIVCYYNSLKGGGVVLVRKEDVKQFFSGMFFTELKVRNVKDFR